MNLLDRLRGTRSAFPTLTFDQYLELFSYNGVTYPVMLTGTLAQDRIEDASPLEEYGAAMYQRNGVVFACMMVRMRLFSEARFQWRQMRNGRPGNLFGTSELRFLEQPWPNGSTGQLLARALQDVDLTGNAFFARRPDGLQRLQPQWVTIMVGENSPIDRKVLGYSYQPGGPGSGEDPVSLLVESVAHFAPIPDPASSFRGMSWLTPIIREIQADSAATVHKLKFFEHGATPNMVVKMGDAQIKAEAFERWVEMFESQHTGVANAYKTLYLAGGADATVVGSDMKQIDFAVTQGKGETRIAAAAGVPPVIVGLSEGLQAATYSNYGQARRSFADGTMRPLWREAARSFQSVLDVPPGSELWYDDRDIAFLREDQKDEAEIQVAQASAIKQLVDAGFQADSVVDAVTAGDLSRLSHTGLFSVQLQPPGTEVEPSGNGKAPAELPA